MSVTQIFRGIVRGSISGYGRFLMRSVVLSSNSADSRVRAAVTDTLKAKIEHGFDPALFPSINRTVMTNALSRADLIGHGLDIPQREAFVYAAQRFIAGCSISELGSLSISDNSLVFHAVQEAAMPHIQEIIQTSIARYLAIFTPKEYVKNILPNFKDSLPDHHVCYVRQGIDGAMDFLSKVHSKAAPASSWIRVQILCELLGINPVLAKLITARFEQIKD